MGHGVAGASGLSELLHQASKMGDLKKVEEVIISQACSDDHSPEVLSTMDNKPFGMNSKLIAPTSIYINYITWVLNHKSLFSPYWVLAWYTGRLQCVVIEIGGVVFMGVVLARYAHACMHVHTSYSLSTLA